MPSLFLHSLTHPSHSFTLTISLCVPPLHLPVSVTQTLALYSITQDTPSLPQSLPHTLPASFTPSLPHSLTHSLNHSHSLCPSCLIHSDNPTLLCHSHTPSLPQSLPHSLPFLPHQCCGAATFLGGFGSRWPRSRSGLWLRL